MPAVPRCPRCRSNMVLRTAKKGPNAGHQFWGCSKYPRCSGTRGYKPEYHPSPTPNSQPSARPNPTRSPTPTPAYRTPPRPHTATNQTGWLAPIAILVALMACILLGNQEGQTPRTTPAATAGPGPAAGAFTDEDNDPFTHSNEKGHVHTRTEWVEGYYRSDGTYVEGHYRKVE